MSIVTSKGRVTIPKPIRDFLGITLGKTDIEFVIVGDHLEVINQEKAHPFSLVKGITQGKMSTDEIMSLTRD